MLLLLILFSLIKSYYSFQLCVVGATSDLGKELIYQGIKRNNTVLALTSNKKPITIPCRTNSFTKTNDNEEERKQ